MGISCELLIERDVGSLPLEEDIESKVDHSDKDGRI